VVSEPPLATLPPVDIEPPVADDAPPVLVVPPEADVPPAAVPPPLLGVVSFPQAATRVARQMVAKRLGIWWNFIVVRPPA
jgi:hypothetical protein